MSPHHALTLFEILDNILSFADNPSRAAAARTCRDWHEPATNSIWRKLESLVPLIQLLAPLTWRLSCGHFAEATKPDGWETFSRAAKRVRFLTHDDTCTFEPSSNTYTTSSLATEVFTRLAIQRPNQELLPNLAELEWLYSRTESLEYVPMFISSRTENITIVLHDIANPSTTQLQFLISHIPLFTQALTSFTIHTVMDCIHVEQGLVHLIRTMKSLRTISLPRYFLTSAIGEALGTHPYLETILHSIDWPGDPEYQSVGTRVSFQEGWFLNLGRISVDVSPSYLTSLLQSSYRPPRLYSIKLTALRQQVDIEDLRELFDAIPVAYPNLTRLLLDLFYPMEGEDELTADEEKEKNNRITFDIIRPLLKCSQMQTFRIWHNYPLDVKEADILGMAKKWPRLVHLDFGEDPVIRPGMAHGLPMIVLCHFATHCRRLQTLYLYLDTSTATSFDECVPRPIPKFNITLEWLSFGTSPVTDVYQIARILSQMCDHDPVAIGYGAGPCHVGILDGGSYEDRGKEWSDVSKLFKSLYRYRKKLESSELHSH